MESVCDSDDSCTCGSTSCVSDAMAVTLSTEIPKPLPPGRLYDVPLHPLLRTSEHLSGGRSTDDQRLASLKQAIREMLNPLPVPPIKDIEDWQLGDAIVSLIESLISERGDAAEQIAIQVAGLGALLLMKNANYGNSALAPVSIFARRMTPSEKMNVRMDDKLSRIVNGAGSNGADGEDPYRDLAGYLLLKLIADMATVTVDPK